MKNKENIELIPKLRFLTFPIKNWDEKKLQDIFIYLSTNTYSSNLLNNKQGIYQNIHYGDILIKYGCIIDAQRDEIPYINKDVKCTTDNIIMDGDIVMADTAEDEIVGKTSEIFNIGDKKILSGLHTFWLRPLISFAPKYLGYFFNSTQYHNQLLPLIQGAKVSSISKKALNNTIIVYPSTSEQQKIADCLSSLDDLIEATAQKVRALEKHKKGLMQRLFPAEGKNVPDLRFPEFQNTESWKEYKLKSLCEIGNGKDYKHLGSGNIPVYGSGGYMTSVDDFLYDGESVCIGRKGTINKPIFLTGKFWTVDTLFYTHSFRNCLPPFLYLIFLQIDWYKYNEAGGVPSLSKTTIGEINILVPVEKKGELKEQQKIANCLFSLDELIEATSQKVEILKEHRKGLMQQLFPKI